MAKGRRGGVGGSLREASWKRLYLTGALGRLASRNSALRRAAPTPLSTAIKGTSLIKLSKPEFRQIASEVPIRIKNAACQTSSTANTKGSTVSRVLSSSMMTSTNKG